MIGMGDAVPGTPQNPFNIPGLPGAIVIPGLSPQVTPVQPATPASADAGLLSVAVSSYNQMTPAGQAQTFGVLAAQGEGASVFTKARALAAGVGAVAGIVLGLVYAKRKRR